MLDPDFLYQHARDSHRERIARAEALRLVARTSQRPATVIRCSMHRLILLIRRIIAKTPGPDHERMGTKGAPTLPLLTRSCGDSLT